MPIWEGFDELYHYGYVQFVAASGTFPVAGKTSLSKELWTSLDYAPASHWIQPYFERPSTSFEEYFRLSEPERISRRNALDLMPRGLQHDPSPRDNYEAKQAPLTYLLLAPFERLLADLAVTTRVFVLRLLLSIASFVLVWVGMGKLAVRLCLAEHMRAASVFVLFSCQMVYATTCHIANDALLGPWLLFFLIAQIDFCESPNLRRAGMAGLWMSTGLLIKSSTLVFVPLVFAAPILQLIRRRSTWWRAASLAAVSAGTAIALAGPWFARNLTLYRNLTATPETSGLSPGDLFRGAMELPWRESFSITFHRALWSGNNTFSSFSAFTIDVALGVFVLSAVAFVLRTRWNVNETLVVASVVLYGVALLGITLAFFVSSGGGAKAPMPWYTEILLAPVIALSFLALGRAARMGRWLATFMVLFWAYLAAATWIAKLIPLYGGFGDEHVRPTRLWSWYLQQSNQRDSILSTLCPGPVWLIYSMLAVVLGTMAVLVCRLCIEMKADKP